MSKYDHTYPPLPQPNIKPLKERLAEARALRGQISETELHTILAAIYGSARDCGEHLDENLTNEYLSPEIETPGIPTIAAIQTVVADHFNISRAEIISKHRRPNVARPRHIAMYLARQLTKKSLLEIGRRFGRDHTTIMDDVRKIAELIKTDPRLANEIAALSKRLLE